MNWDGKKELSGEESVFKYEQQLLEPYDYLSKIPGKKIRTKLIKSFNHWLNIPEDKLNKITEIIEMLHNSSLLVDDIEDSSCLRRGVSAAHTVFGTPLTLNSANYMYFIGLNKVIELDEKKGAKIFAEQLIELHRGQGMEIWFRDKFICPSEDEYNQLVIKKTGGLFKLAIRLMQVFSESMANFDSLIDKIGLFFQIRDDYANLCSKEYADSKSFCEDLTEGKFSYPIIHHIHSKPGDQRIINILKMRTNEIEPKKEAVRILQESDSFSYTIETLKKLKQSILEEVNYHGKNPFLERLLFELFKVIDVQTNGEKNIST